MLRKEDFMVIQALAKRGVYLTDIAAELGVHPKTVSRALKRGGPPAPAPKPRSSKLDPFKPIVDRLLTEDVWNRHYREVFIKSNIFTSSNLERSF
jgi:transposase